jgi:DNA-binding LacI/PurR family transcriptional regulator
MVRRQESERVTLKTVARQVGLAPGTISAVLNNSGQAHGIPQQTKDRIFAAAHELNYQPNFFARSLRKRKSYTIGIMVREIADPWVAVVLSGIERVLREQDYFFIVGVHDNDPTLLENCSRALLQRSVEGLVIVDLTLTYSSSLPTVLVAVREPCDAGRNGSIGTYDSHKARLIHERLENLGNVAAKNLFDQIAGTQLAAQLVKLRFNCNCEPSPYYYELSSPDPGI